MYWLVLGFPFFGILVAALAGVAIYTAMAALVWVIAAEAYRPWLAALVGFTLAFHFALTLYSLKQHQSDITEVGW